MWNLLKLKITSLNRRGSESLRSDSATVSLMSLSEKWCCFSGSERYSFFWCYLDHRRKKCWSFLWWGLAASGNNSGKRDFVLLFPWQAARCWVSGSRLTLRQLLTPLKTLITLPWKASCRAIQVSKVPERTGLFLLSFLIYWDTQLQGLCCLFPSLFYLMLTLAFSIFG